MRCVCMSDKTRRHNKSTASLVEIYTCKKRFAWFSWTNELAM